MDPVPDPIFPGTFIVYSRESYQGLWDGGINNIQDVSNYFTELLTNRRLYSPLDSNMQQVRCLFLYLINSNRGNSWGRFFNTQSEWHLKNDVRQRKALLCHKSVISLPATLSLNASNTFPWYYSSLIHSTYVQYIHHTLTVLAHTFEFNKTKIIIYMGAKVDWDFRISDRVKNPDVTDI